MSLSRVRCLCKGREFGHSVVDSHSVLWYNRSERVEHIHRDVYFVSITLPLGAESEVVLKSTNTAYSTLRGVADALLTSTTRILHVVSVECTCRNLRRCVGIA